MDRIRFDSLYNQLTGAFSRGAGAIANVSSDRFSQILDQQVNGQGQAPVEPAGTQARRADSRRADSESRSRDAYSERPEQPVAANETARRRDRNHAATTQATTTTTRPVAGAKTAATQTAATQTARNPGSGVTAGHRSEVARNAAKSGDAGAADAPQAKGATTAAPTEAEAKRDTGRDDGGQSNADDGKDTDSVTAAADAPVAVPIPAPPLQIATGPVGKVPDAVMGGGQQPLADPRIAALGLDGAAQAALANPDPASDASARGGLTFGSVIAGVTAKTAQPDALAAAKDPTADAADGDGSTSAEDPLTTALSAAQAGNAPAASGRSTSGAGKLRGKGDSLAAATSSAAAKAGAAQQNAKPDLAALRPAAAVAANADTGNPGTQPAAGDDTAEDLTVTSGTAASSDAEYSTWSQYLGSGTGSGNMARAASWPAGDFVAQLKQNLDILPPHEQIAIQIMNAKPNGSSRMTVDLQPAELGRVEVRLDIDKDKKVTATVVVDRPATLDMLQRDAKALERVLQDAGLQADSGSLSFSLRDTGQNGGRDQSGNGGGADKGADGGPGAADTANQPVRADVVATADGYADLEA